MMERVDQERPGWDGDQFDVLTGEEVAGVGGDVAEGVGPGGVGPGKVGLLGDGAGAGAGNDDQAEREDQGDDAGAGENDDGAGPGAGLTGVCIGFHVGAWRVTSRSDLGSGQGSGSSHTRLQNRPRCSNHLSQAMPYRITLTVRPGFSRLLR